MQGWQFFVFGVHVGIQAVDVFEGKTALGLILEILVILDGCIQLFEDAPIVDQVTKRLLRVQPVHPGDGLNQAVTLKLLVDVEHRVAGFVKASQEFVDDD